MSYTLKELPDLSVLLLKLHSNYNFAGDYASSYAEVYQFLETVDKPVYYIMDLTDAQIDMDLILDGVKQTSVNERGSFRHPMTRGVIFVTSDPIAAPVAGGLSEEAFGGINARVFATLDEALDYVEQQT